MQVQLSKDFLVQFLKTVVFEKYQFLDIFLLPKSFILWYAIHK